MSVTDGTVDNLTDPVAGNPFSNSQGLPSTQYFGRAQAAIMDTEVNAIKRTSGNVLMADGFAALPEVLISDAENLTNWAGAGIFDAAVLDTTYFTRGTRSIHVGLQSNPAAGRYNYNLPAAQAVGSYLYAAIDLRWNHIGGPVATSVWFQAVAASGANLTGTLAVQNLQERPMGTFSTVLIPLAGLTSISSIGIRCFQISPQTNSRVQFWIDNVRLKAQSSVETTLGQGPQVAVVVPPSVAADIGPRALAPARNIIDLRPASTVLGGHGGIRHAREWNIAEDGSVDVSADIMTVYNSLPPGTVFQLSPQGLYLCNGTIDLMVTDSTFDGNGATIFSNRQRTLNFSGGDEDHILQVSADGITVKNLRIVAYRKDVFTGSQLTTVTGSPTIVGSTVQLDALNEEVRIPQQLLDTTASIPIAGRNNLETPFYFRDQNSMLKFEANVTTSASVPGDVRISVIDDDFGITLSTTNVTVTAGVPTTLTRTIRGDAYLGTRLRITVRKVTATANVITVNSMTAYNTCGYRPNFQYPAVTEFSHGINIAAGSGVTIENCQIEGPDGDGICVNNTASHNVTIRDCQVRGAGRHGMNPNSGSDLTLENCIMRESGRSGIDIEPTTVAKAAYRVTLKHCHFYNTRNYAIAASNWARNTNLLLENLESDGAGMGFMFGGSQGGNVHNIVHRGTYRTVADRVANGGTANADFIYKGRNSHIDGIVTDLGVHLAAGTNTWDSGSGVVTYTSAGNTLRNVKVTATPSDSGSIIVDAPKSSIANASTLLDSSGAAITWSAGDFIGQARMAADATFSAVDVGTLRTRYPNTYKGLAFSSVWTPGGFNALAEPLTNVRGISGTAVKPNNFAKVTVPIAAGAVGVTVNFPTRGVPAFASVDAPVAAVTAGGTLAPNPYYYRVAPRSLYGGPGPALAEVGPVTVGAPNNSVQLGIRRWAVDGDAQVAGVSIWRGVTPGLYSTRWDVAPNAPFYAIQQDVAVFTDLGATIAPPAASAFTWGYPASVAAAAGALVPADESGFEADVNYAVMVETSWPTSVGVTTKTTGSFHLDFGAAVPAVGGPYFFSWMLVR